VLFLTTSTVDVILNALAIDFVYNFDVAIAEADWYDPGGRYLRASIIEIFLRGELLLEPFYGSKLLCEMYDIDEELYAEKVGGPLREPKQAEIDAKNPKFMSAENRLWIASLAAAKRGGASREAIWQFDEPVAYFGIFDMLFKPKNGGLFKRYGEYFTWSRWDEALFLPRVPPIGGLSSFKGLVSLEGTGTHPREDGFSAVSSNSDKRNRPRFLNFDPESSQSVAYRFFLSIVSVFVCRSLWQSVSTAYRRHNPQQIPFRFIDGLFEIFAFAFVVFCFPTGLIFYLYLIFACQEIV